MEPNTVQELTTFLTAIIKETLTGGFCVLFIWLFLKEKRDHMNRIKECQEEQESMFNKVLTLQSETNKALDKAVDAVKGKKRHG